MLVRQARRVSINGKSLDLAFLWALGHMLEDETDLLLKGRQIPLHHSPDFPQVNAKIVVDQDVAHFDDLWLGYVLVGFPKGGGELAGCFADDLDVMDHPGMDEFVFFKCLTASLHIPFNPLNGQRYPAGVRDHPS